MIMKKLQVADLKFGIKTYAGGLATGEKRVAGPFALPDNAGRHLGSKADFPKNKVYKITIGETINYLNVQNLQIKKEKGMHCTQ